MQDIRFNSIHRGRQRIILDYEEVTTDNVIEILQKALPIFNQNKRDCEYLINYFLGDQDILYRAESKTSEINNTTVVNTAFPITREIVGYTFGNGVEFVQKDLSKKEETNKLSEYYDYETSYYVDMCTGIYASICGFAYQMTLPSSEITRDDTPEVPIMYTALDPRTAFVVQSSSAGHPVLLSCWVSSNKDYSTIYNVFTNDYQFVIEALNRDKITVRRNPIGLNPITMVENSLFLTGDWEQAISVMNATNLISSDALNDIEGTIRALLVIIGAEFDEDDSENSDIKKVKKNRILTLVNGGNTGSNLDAKFISPQLDSATVQSLRDYMEDIRNVITGVPDRSSNSNGGDTGQAVLNRDGWTDIEIVARFKEIFFKKGKKRQLAVGLRILQILGLISEDLKVKDIELGIGRHSTDNLSTKTSAFASLVATGELATIDCLELSNLTNKTREMVERGEQAKKKRQEEEQKLKNKENKNNKDDKNGEKPTE